MANEIVALAKAKWASSGLSDAQARALKLKPLTAKAVKALSPGFQAAGALHIPYFDLKGRPTRFYRLRYLEKLPGFAGQIEKPQRYDQLPVMVEAYYPPLLKASWAIIAKDPAISICITEGELKAACAAARGIPTLALGGVHSFLSSKRGIPFLPSLEEISWTERKVYIVFDNDITHKLPVMRAQRDLAQALLSRGAQIAFISIPAGPEKGLDDYLVKFGLPAFSTLLEAAEPYLESDALWQMNEEVVYIRTIGTVIERATSLRMEPNRFMRHTYANRHYMAQIEVGNGKSKRMVLQKKPLAPRWIEWEQRADLDRLSYAPGKPKVVDGAEWNTWQGWGVVPKRGEMAPWRWLMDFLFQGDAKARRYFEQWCAYPIQNPGAKLYSAVLLWSRAKRLGKSMAAVALSKIYGVNAVTIDSKDLKESFNSWAKDRQLVVGEEITAGEARVDADWLKGVITNPQFTIKEKYQPNYAIRNCMNFLFLSNHPDALFLEDGDMRYFVHEVLQKEPASREQYEVVDKWLHGEGPSHLMYYLMSLDLTGFNPREHAPETSGKLAMIRAGKTDMGLWVMQLKEDGKTALRSLGDRSSAECDLFTPDQLYRAFDPDGRHRGRASVAGLGRTLAAAGFRQVNSGIPVQTETGLHRLYAVRNVIKWEQARRDEIKQHYNDFYGASHTGEVK